MVPYPLYSPPQRRNPFEMRSLLKNVNPVFELTPTVYHSIQYERRHISDYTMTL